MESLTLLLEGFEYVAGPWPLLAVVAGVAMGLLVGAMPGLSPSMGVALLVFALGLGAGLAAILTGFPLPILAGLLAAAGLLHIGLLRDLEGWQAWAIALLIGAIGFGLNLAIALAVGLVLWWVPVGVRRLRSR